MSGDFFGYYNLGEVLLTSRGQKPGMLPNIPQCARQSPTIKNYQAQNVNSANVEKPGVTFVLYHFPPGLLCPSHSCILLISSGYHASLVTGTLHRLRILSLWNWQTSGVQLLSSVQFSRSVMSDSLGPHESQHARPPCPSPTPGVHSDSCPSSP